MSEPQVPAHIIPYVDVLGREGAVTFLLEFGGAEIYLTDRPQERSQLVETIGRKNVVALAERLGHGHARVPLAKPFIAAHFASQKMSVAEIARTLHVSDVTVRSYLNPPTEKRQLNLFTG